MCEKPIFCDFLKVHNELGKVTKFGTSITLFSWRNEHLKIVWADSAPPAPIGLIKEHFRGIHSCAKSSQFQSVKDYLSSIRF